MKSQSQPEDGPWRSFFWVALGWTALAIFCLVDLQWGQRELYFSVASFDQTTRVSIIDAMTRTGVPPINPSYYPGRCKTDLSLFLLVHPWQYRGYRRWKFGGRARGIIRQRCLVRSRAYGVDRFLYSFARCSCWRRWIEPWRRAMIGIASISITGLDLLPSIILMGFGKGVLGDIRHWNEQITA